MTSPVGLTVLFTLGAEDVGYLEFGAGIFVHPLHQVRRRRQQATEAGPTIPVVFCREVCP